MSRPDNRLPPRPLILDFRNSDGAPKPDGALKNVATSKVIHYHRLFLDRPDGPFV